MKSHSHKIYTSGRLHLCLTAFFLFLLFAARFIPQEKIQEHRALSLQLLSEFPENSYLPGSAPALKSETEFLNSLDENPEYSTLWNTLLGQDQGFRWNGMQALARPLLCFFHIGQIRYLCMIFFFMLLFWAAWSIGKHFSAPYGFFFLFFFLWADILPVSWLLPQTGCYLTAFGAILFLCKKNSYFREENRYKLFLTFYGIGTAAAFLDTGTVPVLTLGLSLTVAFLFFRNQIPRQKDSVIWKSLSGCTLSWLLGYLLMTVTKWLLTILITGKNLFPAYLARIKGYCFGSSLSAGSLKTVLFENLSGFLSHVGFGKKILLVLMLAIFVIYLILFFTGHKSRQTCIRNLPLIFIGMLPFLSYLLAPAHGLSESVVTFRALAAAFWPWMLFFYSMLDLPQIRRSLHTIWNSAGRN